MNDSRRWLSLLVAGVVVTGCAGSEPESDPELGEATSAIWSVGSDLIDVEWDSGMTGNISGWKEISCYSTYGHDYLVTGVKAFKDSGSSDNFIAKLTGECSEYSDTSGDYSQTGNTATEVLFTANHKEPGDWTHVDVGYYAMGVELETDNFSDFVKTIRFRTVNEANPGVLGSYSNPRDTPAVGPSNFIIGPLHDVDCPDQYVVAALSVKYDTSKGKIRRVKLGCRPLTD